MSTIRTEDIDNLPLPAGYCNHLSNPAYIAREAEAQKGFRMVGNDSCAGVSWQFGPLRLERYMGDVEPTYTSEGPLRIVTWQPILRRDTPNNWKESRFVMQTSRTGFAFVSESPEYYANWSSHAKRHRKHWLKQDWEIVPITAEEYLAAYKKSTMDKFLKLVFSNLLRQKVKTHGANVHIVGAKRKAPNSPIEAGFVYVDVPEVEQSLHLMSFHTKESKQFSAGVGLMDYWFQHARTNGVKYLEFGCFWTPGEPRSWKGFSHFKGQFGIQYTDYPRPLARWMGSVRRILG